MTKNSDWFESLVALIYLNKKFRFRIFQNLKILRHKKFKENCVGAVNKCQILFKHQTVRKCFARKVCNCFEKTCGFLHYSEKLKAKFSAISLRDLAFYHLI